MKRFITGVLALAFLAVPVGQALAATSFNNNSLDFDTLRIGNYTDSPSSTSASWGTSVSADAGETINLAVYYHNNGNETAKNVRVRLTPQNTGSVTSQTFNAYITADNMSQVSGSASVNLSSSQTVSYSAIAWRPNQSTWGSANFPNGQNGNEIFSSNGVLIGDIAPGWGTQGNIIVSFAISNNSNNNNSNNNAVKPTVSTKQATNIEKNSAVLKGDVNPNGVSGTTYWFDWGTSSSFGNKTAVSNHYGYVSGVEQIISGLSPDTIYYYRVVAENSNGTSYGQTYYLRTLEDNTVAPAVQPSVTTNSANSISKNGAMLNAYVNSNGLSNTQYWFQWGTSNSFGNATNRANLSGSANNVSQSISGLSSDTIYYYRVVAENSNGTSYGDTYYLRTLVDNTAVTQTEKPSVFTNSATSITKNDARLNASVDANGSGTYWFEYGTSSSLGNSTSRQSINSTVLNSVSQYVNGLSPNTIYYYRVVAENSNGTSYGETYYLRTLVDNTVVNTPVVSERPAVVTNSATPITKNSARLNASIDSKGVNTQYWFQWGTSNSFGNSTGRMSLNSSALSGVSQDINGLSPDTIYYYRVVAENSNGTSYGETYYLKTLVDNVSSVNSGNNKVLAVSNLATNVDYDSARLNGMALINDGVATYGWFEWGTSNSLGNKTDKKLIGSNPSVSFKESMFGLSSGTTYYFRAVVENIHGTNYGNILSFTTKGGSVYNPTSTDTTDTKTHVITGTVISGGNGFDKDEDKEEDENEDKNATSTLASVMFGAEGFMPNTLFEWLLLFAVVAVLIYLGRRTFSKEKTDDVQKIISEQKSTVAEQKSVIFGDQNSNGGMNVGK